MNEELEEKKANLLSALSGGFWKPFAVALGVFVIVALLVIAGTYTWAQTYNGRVLPNTFVGELDLGGMHPQSAQTAIQARVDEILNAGVRIELNGIMKALALVTLAGTDTQEDTRFDIEGLVERLLDAHGSNPLDDTIRVVTALFRPSFARVDVVIQKETVTESVRALFPDVETLAAEPAFEIVFAGEAWQVTTLEGTRGYEFEIDPLLETLQTQLETLDNSDLVLNVSDTDTKVTYDQAQMQEATALTALGDAPYTAQQTLGEDREPLVWEMTAVQLATMIIPGEKSKLALNRELFDAWATTIQEQIDVDAVNARLDTEDGRVIAFVQSSSGQHLDVDMLFEGFVELIQTSSEQPTVEITLIIEEPTVTIADVNDLGITEVLGVGTSSYLGSPYNRRLNIQNGVDLLNGRLIAPGETFSLIEALSPFTYANGYFPELVIKGDKIEPEMAGGLCQIGTTTFRATMNSGLEITERRNHSLVVSYYNDATNGLPGTDATIYEPAPDYKFTNNTDHHVLFQAENLTETSELRFSFWGTSDGRQGSYTPPVVDRWIGVGEEQRIETEDLEPGVEECQSAHVGADAHFYYTVVTPDGETEETLYESHYRPLARICLVGVDPDAEEVEEGEEIVEGEEETTEEEETETES